jgi:DNA invertase Pin-like site-specific DNA recombinase
MPYQKTYRNLLISLAVLERFWDNICMTRTCAPAPASSSTCVPGGIRNLVGLARVSTDAQDNALQMEALNAAHCGRIFTDTVSSRKDVADRPGLVAALDYLREGDTLCVWQLDRLGRSTKEMLTIADDLNNKGIGLRILAGTLVGEYQPTGSGKLFFTILSAFAEFERDQIHMRTMAGLKAARAKGNIGGRPKVVDADKLAAAQARKARGESVTQIAKALGIGRTTAYRYLNGEGE